MTKKTPRILFISRAYGEHAGGMERLSFELINAFKKTDSSPSAPREALAKWGSGGVEFEVSAIFNETKPHQSLFVSRVRSALFVITMLPKALLASRNADVIHIGDPVLSLIGWCIARVRNIPVAVTVHGVDISYTNQIYKAYLHLFFRNFAAYIPISNYAKNLLEKHSVRGIISVIPPGIHDNFYDATRTKQDLSNMLQRDVSQNTVLSTTGRLVARKGHEWFIRNVFPKLPQNFIYVIAGSGSERENISQVIRSLRLQDRVFMLGRVSSEDQKTILNTIDAFIQPNIAVTGDVEGFGIAPLEAALCNRAVFASNIDGIPSAIHDGKNGTLLGSSNADAWIDALSKPMPQINSREYTLKTFGWDRVVEEYKRVFSSSFRT
ncbi:MAG: glycosyltransferase family 4 protein [Patescibacteria group bacterium]